VTDSIDEFARMGELEAGASSGSVINSRSLKEAAEARPMPQKGVLTSLFF
jgi:hypothetical protein